MKELRSSLNGLYVLVKHALAVTDAAKMLQLGTALGKDYKDFMRNNAYQAHQTYAALCVLPHQTYG